MPLGQSPDGEVPPFGPKPASDDPFFSLAGPPHWNAFVGRQGEDRYYIDGYLEAALELASAVIDKGLTGQRDTLVMPILFSARHGLELSMKDAIAALAAAGLMQRQRSNDHDLVALWDALAQVPRCDAHLPTIVHDLHAFVKSLAAVDQDGQALRYPTRMDGSQSLADCSLVNLEVVRHSLTRLQDLLGSLGMRVADLVDERRSGTCTTVCSRSDLFMMAGRLPPRVDWSGQAFADVKRSLCAELGLSGRQFANALDAIQAHRQMGSRLGLKFDMAALDDESALHAIMIWRSLHPKQEPPTDGTAFTIVPARSISFEGLNAELKAEAAAADQLLKQLTPAALADLDAIYEIGRHGEWPESYTAHLAQAKAAQDAENGVWERASYLLGKANLGDAVADGVTRLGRPKLAEALRLI